LCLCGNKVDPLDEASTAACTNLCTDDQLYARNKSYTCGGPKAVSVYRSARSLFLIFTENVHIYLHFCHLFFQLLITVNKL